MMMDHNIHKLIFLNLLHQNFRLFFIQLILIYEHEDGQCPKHSGSESLPLQFTTAAVPLQKSYGVVAVLKKYQTFKNRRRLRYRS